MRTVSTTIAALIFLNLSLPCFAQCNILCIENFESGVAQFCPVSSTFCGLPIEALGTATLKIGDSLVLSNIGSSGDDGIAVDFSSQTGSATENGFRTDLIPIDLSKEGAMIEIDLLDFFGTTSTPAMNFGCTNISGMIMGAADFDVPPINCLSIALEFLNSNGNSISTVVCDGGDLFKVSGNPTPQIVSLGVFNGQIKAELNNPATVTLLCGPMTNVANVSEIRVKPTDCMPFHGGVNPLTGYKIKVANMNSLEMLSQDILPPRQ